MAPSIPCDRCLIPVRARCRTAIPFFMIVVAGLTVVTSCAKRDPTVKPASASGNAPPSALPSVLPPPAASPLAEPSGPPPRLPRTPADRTRRYVRIVRAEYPVNSASVPREELSPEALAALKAQSHDVRTQWVFEGFDGKWLDFSFSRLPRPDNSGGAPTVVRRVHFVTERRVRVARTERAEELLWVSPVVDLYEIGIAGIRGGMTAADVVARLGEPLAEDGLGAYGNCDFIYSDREIRFLGNAVASIGPAVQRPWPVRPGGHCAGRLGSGR